MKAKATEFFNEYMEFLEIKSEELDVMIVTLKSTIRSLHPIL